MKMYSSNEIAWCCFGVMVSIFMRVCTSLHPYSGKGNPPMYGDYEAQRHWMEITVHLPMNQWYHNSTINDLNYWGLDYPPLTAYHSYLCGLVAYVINPKYVELISSRGYESEDHKIFMRYTVLVADLFIYIPAVVCYFVLTKQLYKNECAGSLVTKKGKKAIKNTNDFPLRCSVIMGLLYPGLILIDHGHFQYNCVSLGFAVIAVTCLFLRSDVIGSVFFCLALNYKQMELYHAFPFFFYLLSSCIPKPGEHTIMGLFKLSRIALSVVITFGILWLPFIFNIKDFLQVVHRLFPIARGVFEDKVANVWCTLNIFYKFKSYCSLQMIRYCTVATLTAILPSSADLFLRPNIQKFVPALINSSLAFFLFSYQVHEKSVLLAAIPAILYFPQEPIACFWFLYITNFSMLPLYVKDGLIVAYISLTFFYCTAFLICHERWGIDLKSDNTFYMFYKQILEVLVGAQNNKRNYGDIVNIAYKHIMENHAVLKKLVLYIIMFFSFLGSLLLTTLIIFLEPPGQYPDLYPLIISVYSCLHFLSFYMYFTIVQFWIPQSFEDVHIKLKES